ncbi:MAG: cation diffusion facilitator family transporter [Candidatus Hadarchaeum sp.]|uniref:cation diffusion facilitator family transporter n=1 Tax=Candidatus Hadarchaeum sp. TaxID=2883567 RepID=UPI0031792224
MLEQISTFTDSRLKASRRLMLAFLLTASVFVAEVIGGILSNSLSLIGDAGHMLVDSVALAVGVSAFKLAMRPATKRKTYGYYRLEILAALFNGLLLFIVAFYIFSEAYRRFTTPAEVRAPLMLAVAVAGLAVNFLSLGILWKVRKENLNVKGTFSHVFSDTISSVGVIAAAVIIYFSQLFIVDALIGILIGGIILRSAVALISESGRVLLEAVPEGIDPDRVVEKIKKIDGVQDVHDLHIWSISSGINSLSGHIVIDDQKLSKAEEILRQVDKLLKENFSIIHTTIQLECKACQEPFVCSLGGK